MSKVIVVLKEVRFVESGGTQRGDWLGPSVLIKIIKLLFDAIQEATVGIMKRLRQMYRNRNW
jgi:hypothetical protein